MGTTTTRRRTFYQQVQQQRQQERLNQLRQRLIQLHPQARAQPQPQPQAQAQGQQDAITALQQQLAQERERTVAFRNQKRESQRLSEEIRREQQAQETLQRQLVRSSDIFPATQSVRSTDVFPRPAPPPNLLYNLPPTNLAAQLTIPPPLIPPYQAPPQPPPLIPSYQPVQPPQHQVVDEDPFSEIADLGNFDNSYLEGVRQKLAKTINNVTWLINADEGEAYLTPE